MKDTRGIEASLSKEIRSARLMVGDSELMSKDPCQIDMTLFRKSGGTQEYPPIHAARDNTTSSVGDR